MQMQLQLQLQLLRPLIRGMCEFSFTSPDSDLGAAVQNQTLHHLPEMCARAFFTFSFVYASVEQLPPIKRLLTTRVHPYGEGGLIKRSHASFLICLLNFMLAGKQFNMQWLFGFCSVKMSGKCQNYSE